MAVEIWPHITPAQLKIEEDATQARELTWLLTTLKSTLRSVKHGLEDSYALLAPIDPGSTLVLTTPRNELVKGHVTRVGTRIVKGTINLKLRTLPAQTLTFDANRPIHLAPLTALNTILNQSVELLSMCVAETPSADFLWDQLRLLAQLLSEAIALLKGPSGGVEGQLDRGWTHGSVSPVQFNLPANTPPNQAQHLRENLSVYFTIQDASLVLYLRGLEPADAPVNFGTKLALVIGTARRLEHDESDKVFGYCPQAEPVDVDRDGVGKVTARDNEMNVFVREKVKVESADPSLMSLSAKLSALSNTLALARRNLAAILGREIEE